MSVLHSALGLMNVSMPMLLKASTYSVRFTFVMTFGTPMWLAYMEMMRFSSSIFVNVMTASVELMPSAARMSWPGAVGFDDDGAGKQLSQLHTALMVLLDDLDAQPRVQAAHGQIIGRCGCRPR